MVATWVDRAPQMWLCCGHWGRMSTHKSVMMASHTEVLWPLAKDTKSVAETEGNLRCCSGYIGCFRTTKMASVTTEHS